MKFRPLHDRVVIRRAEGDGISKGGIIIPDHAKEKPQEGEVIAVGLGVRDEGGKLIPLAVKEGDAVLFGKWSGTEITMDREDLLIMKEIDILGIVDPAKVVRTALQDAGSIAALLVTTEAMVADIPQKDAAAMVGGGY